MDWTRILRTVFFLENLPDEDLNFLKENSRLREFKCGEAIIKEGEIGDQLFIILEGKVNVYKGLGSKSQKQFHTFGPNSYFGEMSLIDKKSRSASVIAGTDVKVLCVNREAFQNQIRRSPDLALDILEKMSLRIRAMNKLIMGTLGEMPPICVRCNKVREPDDKWVHIDRYIMDYSDMHVSQSMCPECSKKNFPQFYADK